MGEPSTHLSVPVDTGATRFRRNLLANLVYFVLSAGLQLWYTRYLVHHLGPETYGLIPLAVTVTNCLSIFTVALSGSVGRFLTIALARGDVASANRSFNTSLMASLVAGTALLPVVAVGAWFSPCLLAVPAGQESGTRWLLLAAGIAFALNAVGSNFACCTFCKNRLDVQRTVELAGLLMQLGVVVALFSARSPELWQVAAGLLAMALVRQAGYQIAWRKLTPELSIRPSAFDRGQLRAILGMGGWLTVDSAGAVLLLQLDLLVVNVVVGADAAGYYAPGLQWVTLLTTISGMLGSAIAPTLMARHAQGDLASLTRITTLAVRLMGLAMAVPIGLLCGLARPVLTVWLGADYAPHWPLFVALILPLAANAPVRPLSSVNQASGHVMWPALMLLATGVLALGLAVVFAGPLGLGALGVAVARGGLWGAKCLLWNPIYTARVLKQPWWTYVLPLAPGVAASVGLAALVALIAGWLGVSSLWSVIACASVVTLAYGAIVVPLLINRSDRATLLGVLRGKT